MVSPAAWFIRQRAAHEYSSSAPRRVARFLGIMCAATLLSGLISSFAARAQPTQPTPAPSATAQPSAEEAAKREALRATIARAPAPKKGCFTAPYPKTEWQEFPCAPPSGYPNQASGPRPDTVGLGSDYSAQVSGISSAAGSFDSVTPAAITEGGCGGGRIVHHQYRYPVTPPNPASIPTTVEQQHQLAPSRLPMHSHCSSTRSTSQLQRAEASRNAEVGNNLSSARTNATALMYS
jgi:hypothetical protein